MTGSAGAVGGSLGAGVGESDASGVAGAGVGGAVLLVETMVGRVAPRRVLSASFGLLIGLGLATLAGLALAPMDAATGTIVHLGLAVGRRLAIGDEGGGDEIDVILGLVLAPGHAGAIGGRDAVGSHALGNGGPAGGQRHLE